MSLALTVCTIVSVALGLLSFGIYFALLLLSILSLHTRLIALRRNCGRVSSKAFPELHELARTAARRLGVKPPEVFVSQRQEWNAYASGFARDNYVVLDAQLVEDFEPEELLFVLGHEIGHIANGHTTLLHFCSPFGGRAAPLFLPFSGIFHIWSHRAEYTADRAGLIACGSLDTALDTLSKLGAGNLAPAYSRENQTGDRGPGTVLSEYLSSHPFVLHRLQQLESFEKAESKF